MKTIKWNLLRLMASASLIAFPFTMPSLHAGSQNEYSTVIAEGHEEHEQEHGHGQEHGQRQGQERSSGASHEVMHGERLRNDGDNHGHHYHGNHGYYDNGGQTYYDVNSDDYDDADSTYDEDEGN